MMTQVYPVGARAHVNAGRTGLSAADSSAPSLVESTGATPTVPLSIVAPRRVGESELAVYPVALGAASFGTVTDVESAGRILDRYVAMGGTALDTADSWGEGASERIIGEWMRRTGKRDSLVLSTKVGRSAENPGLGQVSLVRAVEASLRRLGTDHIDLLALHGDDPSVNFADTLATVEWLIDTGKVRYLGLADFSAQRIMEARILASSGLPKVAAIQTRYNLMWRHEFEGDVRIVSAAQDLGVMPYEGLASGFLAGNYRSRSDVAKHFGKRAAVGDYLGRRGHRVLSMLDRIAAQRHSSMASVAIAWLLAKRGVVAPIIGATRADQIDDIVGASLVGLTRSDMLELDRVSE